MQCGSVAGWVPVRRTSTSRGVCDRTRSGCFRCTARDGKVRSYVRQRKQATADRLPEPSQCPNVGVRKSD